MTATEGLVPVTTPVVTVLDMALMAAGIYRPVFTMFVAMYHRPVIGPLMNNIYRLMLTADHSACNGAEHGAEDGAFNNLIVAGADNSTGGCADYGTGGHGTILIGCSLSEWGSQQGCA